jgi:hypothetical protein
MSNVTPHIRLWMTFLLFVILAISCGSEDNKEPEAKDLSRTFKSLTKGYSVEPPEQWTVKENFATLAGVQADAFISPDGANGFAVNVNILCERGGAGYNTDDYVKANIESLKGLEVIAATKGKVKTANKEGVLITYTAVFGGRNSIMPRFFWPTRVVVG